MAFFSNDENLNRQTNANCYCQNRGGFCPANVDNTKVPEEGVEYTFSENTSPENFPKFVRDENAHYPNDLKQMESDTYESCCCEENNNDCCCENNNECCCEENNECRCEENNECECQCSDNDTNDIILTTLQTLIESILILRKDIDEIKSKLQ